MPLGSVCALAFKMAGYDCCRGLGKESEIHKTEDCSLVTQLRSLGAIPIVRTNVPQLLLAYVCSNPVYGTTCNPYNVERSLNGVFKSFPVSKEDFSRTTGGSSGGEGALVAAGGTVFGTGSDLLGSLRIPAHFCGLYTMKPTSGEFSQCLYFQ